jgi:hypothetical protein
MKLMKSAKQVESMRRLLQGGASKVESEQVGGARCSHSSPTPRTSATG